MSSNLSNRLLIFAAAISVGYLLMEFCRPLFAKSVSPEVPVAETVIEEISLSTAQDYVIVRPSKAQDHSRPAYIPPIEPEDEMKIHQEQIRLMREELRTNPESANRDDGMTEEEIDRMARSGAINI